jgi:hypothetical protein
MASSSWHSGGSDLALRALQYLEQPNAERHVAVRHDEDHCAIRVRHAKRQHLGQEWTDSPRRPD